MRNITLKIKSCLKFIIIAYVYVYFIYILNLGFGVEPDAFVVVSPKEANTEYVTRMCDELKKHINMSIDGSNAFRYSFQIKFWCGQLNHIDKEELSAVKRIINKANNGNSYLEIRLGGIIGSPFSIKIDYSDTNLTFLLCFISVLQGIINKPWFYVWLPSLIVWLLIQLFKFINMKQLHG